jgi:multidrug resistance efflux pump
MISFLLIVYTGFILVLFKLKLVKPRPFPIAWTVVGGVLIIGGVYVAWMLCAPMSPKVVTTQYVVQLVPYVKGQVKKVHARPNQPMKKGDLLLEIDPTPYQNALDQVTAQLESAKENVNQGNAALKAADAEVVTARDGINQAQAALDQAKAEVVTAQSALDKAKADDDLAKTVEQIDLNLQKMNPGAISVQKVAESTQKRLAADATVKEKVATVLQSQASQRKFEANLTAAQSKEKQAEAADQQAGFMLKVYGSNVLAVQAQLSEAKFNLDQCKMYAPADGYVVDWQIQEGSWAEPMRLLAVGTFIVTGETFIVAVFPQNYLMNVQSGDEVELVLDPYPGRLFKGKVENVITATGEGQYTPSGNIPYAAKVGSMGVLAVKIQLDPGEQPPDLPLGAGGTVAIYTDHGKPVHVISKVAIRMKKWLLYVLPTVEKKS